MRRPLSGLAFSLAAACAPAPLPYRAADEARRELPVAVCRERRESPGGGEPSARAFARMLQPGASPPVDCLGRRLAPGSAGPSSQPIATPPGTLRALWLPLRRAAGSAGLLALVGSNEQSLFAYALAELSLSGPVVHLSLVSRDGRLLVEAHHGRCGPGPNSPCALFAEILQARGAHWERAGGFALHRRGPSRRGGRERRELVATLDLAADPPTLSETLTTSDRRGAVERSELVRKLTWRDAVLSAGEASLWDSPAR